MKFEHLFAMPSRLVDENSLPSRLSADEADFRVVRFFLARADATGMLTLAIGTDEKELPGPFHVPTDEEESPTLRGRRAGHGLWVNRIRRAMTAIEFEDLSCQLCVVILSSVRLVLQLFRRAGIGFDVVALAKIGRLEKRPFRKSV